MHLPQEFAILEVRENDMKFGGKVTLAQLTKRNDIMKNLA
jgi:hypothetical protein